MAVTRITLVNFSVFETLDIQLSEGVNVFIGENGTGKTHLMKILYAACQAVDTKVSFAHKIVKVFRPDDFRIGRLVNRKPGNLNANAKIYASKADSESKDLKALSISFSIKTKKWEAEVTGEEQWEKQFSKLMSTFIPAKEILSNSFNLNAAVDKNNVDFDDTYIDIINSAKIDITMGKDSTEKRKYLSKLQNIINGRVSFDAKQDKFYLWPSGRQSKIEFHLVAEGVRKIALLWQLVKNGTLEKGSVLFWDEPEANINPIHVPLIVEMLLELQKSGVQIIVSTHDYIFAKYFEVKRKDSNILFHSLFKTANGVQCETNENFRDLKNNAIISSFDQLLDEVYFAHVED